VSKRYREDIANQILRDLAKINPYTSNDSTKGSLYAAGFLAGYLAQLSEQDPWVYKKLKAHIEQQQRFNRKL
jgi:flagellar hook assembly protein FlgD